MKIPFLYEYLTDGVPCKSTNVIIVISVTSSWMKMTQTPSTLLSHLLPSFYFSVLVVLLLGLSFCSASLNLGDILILPWKSFSTMASSFLLWSLQLPISSSFRSPNFAKENRRVCLWAEVGNQYVINERKQMQATSHGRNVYQHKRSWLQPNWKHLHSFKDKICSRNLVVQLHKAH